MNTGHTRWIFLQFTTKVVRQMHREWLEIELKNGSSIKNSLWSGSVAIGSEYFIKDIQQKLAGRVQGRSAISHNGTTVLKEPQALYCTFLANQKGLLSSKNTDFLPNNF